jgi:hypothetical protein
MTPGVSSCGGRLRGVAIRTGCTYVYVLAGLFPFAYAVNACLLLLAQDIAPYIGAPYIASFTNGYRSLG